jgi:hypothetical protein
MNLDKRTQQEILAVIRYQITIAPHRAARENLWDLYLRVAGYTKHKDFWGFFFSEFIVKRGGLVLWIAIGFLCVFLLKNMNSLLN